MFAESPERRTRTSGLFGFAGQPPGRCRGLGTSIPAADFFDRCIVFSCPQTPGANLGLIGSPNFRRAAFAASARVRARAVWYQRPVPLVSGAPADCGRQATGKGEGADARSRRAAAVPRRGALAAPRLLELPLDAEQRRRAPSARCRRRHRDGAAAIAPQRHQPASRPARRRAADLPGPAEARLGRLHDPQIQGGVGIAADHRHQRPARPSPFASARRGAVSGRAVVSSMRWRSRPPRARG